MTRTPGPGHSNIGPRRAAHHAAAHQAPTNKIISSSQFFHLHSQTNFNSTLRHSVTFKRMAASSRVSCGRVSGCRVSVRGKKLGHGRASSFKQSGKSAQLPGHQLHNQACGVICFNTTRPLHSLATSGGLLSVHVVLSPTVFKCPNTL